MNKYWRRVEELPEIIVSLPGWSRRQCDFTYFGWPKLGGAWSPLTKPLAPGWGRMRLSRGCWGLPAVTGVMTLQSTIQPSQQQTEGLGPQGHMAGSTRARIPPQAWPQGHCLSLCAASSFRDLLLPECHPRVSPQPSLSLMNQPSCQFSQYHD